MDMVDIAKNSLNDAGVARLMIAKQQSDVHLRGITPILAELADGKINQGIQGRQGFSIMREAWKTQTKLWEDDAIESFELAMSDRDMSFVFI